MTPSVYFVGFAEVSIYISFCVLKLVVRLSFALLSKIQNSCHGRGLNLKERYRLSWGGGGRFGRRTFNFFTLCKENGHRPSILRDLVTQLSERTDFNSGHHLNRVRLSLLHFVRSDTEIWIKSTIKKTDPFLHFPPKPKSES